VLRSLLDLATSFSDGTHYHGFAVPNALFRGHHVLAAGLLTMSQIMVRRCVLTDYKPVLKGPMVSALDFKVAQSDFKMCFHCAATSWSRCTWRSLSRQL
jgi:hypothetical protein